MYSDSLNPFGMLDGQLVTVESVPSGLACGCLCPACGAPLVAKKGPQNVHHFSHAVKTDCKGALETALHIKAKDVLSRFNQIMLPSYYHPERYRKPWAEHKPCVYFYSNALIETKIGRIRPDVVLDGLESKPLIIEIFVTHAIDNQKAIEIKEIGLPCLEIDLRYLKRLNLLDEKLIENGVVHCLHTKRWINKPSWLLTITSEHRQPIKERERLGGQYLGMSQRAEHRFGR